MEKFWIRKTFPFRKLLQYANFGDLPLLWTEPRKTDCILSLNCTRFIVPLIRTITSPNFLWNPCCDCTRKMLKKSALKTLFPLGVKTSQRQVATNLTWQFHQVVAGLLKSCLLRRVVCRLVFLQLSEITCRKLVWQSNCNYSTLTTQQTCSNLCVFWLFVSLHEFIFLVHSNKFGEVFIVWVLKTNKISEENDHMLVSLYDRVTG